MPGEAEGAASLSLTLLIATTLAGKIFEGTEKLRQGKVGKVLKAATLPPSVLTAQKELNRLLNGAVFRKIRDKLAFHYPDALDLPSYSHPDGADSIIYASSLGGDGDFLSHLSSLAVVDPLVQLRPSADWKLALEAVLSELITAAGHYSHFIAGAIAVVLAERLQEQLRVTNLPNPDPPGLLDHPLHFFARPPEDAVLTENA